jgi:hypothetical protein
LSEGTTTVEVLIFVAAVVAALIVVDDLARRLRAAKPVFEPGLAPRVRIAGRPAQLIRLESVVRRSSESAADAQTLLRPVLAEIASARLARRGLSLDDPQAPELLGPLAWSWVRADRPPPRQAGGRGVSQRQLDAVLDALESL